MADLSFSRLAVLFMILFALRTLSTLRLHKILYALPYAKNPASVVEGALVATLKTE